ncbi:MAG: hypoxanthine phosphoribosyltransferase [Leptospira sp.]|nr:hypoxanthine phosphoribosyltransferase [Leptospira sp.]
MEIPLRVIHSELEIKKTVDELGRQISEQYRGKDLLLVGILNGAFIFLADLSRSLSIPHKIDFMGASSYGDATQSSGNVKITKYPDTNPQGKDILIVEDVIETGLTLGRITGYFLEEGASSVRICSLIVKEKPGRKSFPADFVGYREGDEFLIGYGMDYAGLYRNLPFLATLDDPSLLDENTLS